MTVRRTVLTLAAGIVLGLSVSVGTIMAAQQGGEDLVLASTAFPVPQSETLQAGEGEGYLIRTVDNEVCVFQKGELVLHTGVIASLLPQQDREALETGIPAADQAALTALLEDLSS